MLLRDISSFATLPLPCALLIAIVFLYAILRRPHVIRLADMMPALSSRAISRICLLFSATIAH